MDNYSFKLRIRNKLLSVHSSKSVNESQIVIRCPFCGDSVKNSTSAHFFIKIELKLNTPIIFHCFLCDISGVMTPSILRTFRINDLQINSKLLSYNKETIGKINKKLGIKNNIFDFKIPMSLLKELIKEKKYYIENRLGINITEEELIELKVVFNFGEFLRHNNIKTLTTNKEQASILHNNYVGFLSAKNEHIVFRDISGKYKRYFKYSIYKNLDNTRKFYSIPNSIDLLLPKTITINIAEGVFDILGLYYNIFDKEKENTIYTAVCGCGFTNVLKFYIQSGIIGNVDINIFSDKDKKPWFYKNLFEELNPFVNKIKLYYNSLGKDYGVKKNEINLIKRTKDVLKYIKGGV